MNGFKVILVPSISDTFSFSQNVLFTLRFDLYIEISEARTRFFLAAGTVPDRKL